MLPLKKIFVTGVKIRYYGSLNDDREQERMGALNVEITTYIVLNEKGGKMGQKKGQKYLNILCD